MKLQSISKADFQQIEVTRQIIVHDYARAWAKLNLGDNYGSYGISWRDPSVEPLFEIEANSSLIWLGIEQRLAAINLNNGRIALILPTTSNLVQILCDPLFVAVLTEQELNIFNPSGSLRLNCGLPDLGEVITRRGENLEIQLFSGNTLKLNPQTGSIAYPDFV